MSTNLQFVISVTAILAFIWFVLWIRCCKNRNREIEFNVRELATERELFRMARMQEIEYREAMRRHYEAVDQAMADLENTLNNWEPRKRTKVNWQKEGF